MMSNGLQTWQPCSVCDARPDAQPIHTGPVQVAVIRNPRGDEQSFEKFIVDTTVQPKAVQHPTDARLYR
jgi:hypothetical protein